MQKYGTVMVICTLVLFLGPIPSFQADDLEPITPSPVSFKVPVLRGFADDFARSPGHGIGQWQIISGTWDISFTFDPNRIPYQYGLVGKAQKAKALILVNEPPWRGCRMSFSFMPLTPGMYGAVFDYGLPGVVPLYIGFQIKDGTVKIHFKGAGLDDSRDRGIDIRLNQWHRIVIERWAWVVRVIIDEDTQCYYHTLSPQSGKAGLFISEGSAVFDDVVVNEILWHAEDKETFSMPWVVEKGAQWFRNKKPGSDTALFGIRGAVSASMPGMQIEEILIEETFQAAGNCLVTATGLIRHAEVYGTRIFRRKNRYTPGCTTLFLAARDKKVEISRIAIRYGNPVNDTFVIGPYYFTKASIQDPSDYLDFTPQEYKYMRESARASVLKRSPKTMPLVSSSAEYKSPWIIHRGTWEVKQGALTGKGPNSVLRHTQEIINPFGLRLKIKMAEPDSTSDIVLYTGPGQGITVRISTESNKSSAKQNYPFMYLHVPADRNWHELFVNVLDTSVSAQVDKKDTIQCSFDKGDGGRTLFKVISGTVQFDDIEFIIPRKTENGSLYTFDRRETDWWREGGKWIDHGGIACVLASNWISLIASKANGFLWNKHPVGSDVMIAFNIEENSTWFGWGKQPSHMHYPFDNICVILSPEMKAENKGYRLEVNAHNRSATVLYRNGKEVARTAQNRLFPMRHTGGHAPYRPRINHICLVKQGNTFRVIITGKTVLTYKDPDLVDVKYVAVGGYNTRVNFSFIEIVETGDIGKTAK